MTNYEHGALPPRPPLFIAPPVLDKTGRPLIQRLLIANRGEIAVRIIQTCRKLNIASVAVYVEEDSTSQHIHLATESICLGSINHKSKDESKGGSKSNPFLDIDLLVKTAVQARVDAVHPGYGYLSENAEFAARVREAGILFVGPGARAMRALGDKRAAKEFLRANAPDVPLIPGFEGADSEEELERAAREIGFPVMVKASAGGGGKGMRVVREVNELKGEVERARSEAGRAFGSRDCILEKYIESAKHVEVQIVGDGEGEVVSFFERDCSVQRRHQKVVEETPCRFLGEGMRREMGAVAVRIARLIGYENAGTVEFVVDVQMGKFYFLEVNARLQVEHPITEEVTGFDLVALQLYVAAGGSLRALPAPVQRGHAIECRLCAEDPQNNFFPEHGIIRLWRPAGGDDVRYETAIRTGSEVSIHFDSMIAKIVVWAPSRELAIEKMIHVLANTACVGVKTNQLFLQRCLRSNAFHQPTYTTSFIPSHLPELLDLPANNAGDLISIIPSLAIRRLPETCGSVVAEKRPFQRIRKQFRNQHYDPVSVHCDVVTVVSGPKLIDPLMCLWEPPVAGASTSTDRVRLVPVPEASSKSSQDESGSAVGARYIAISNHLRNRPSSTSSTVRIESWHPVEGSPKSWQASTMEVSVDGRKILAHMVIESAHSLAAASAVDRPQRVYCHFPALGMYVEFQRDTLLSFSEGFRTAGEKQKGEERQVMAPMPCKVLSVDKKNGDEVKVGEVVMVIESMKMEVSITASASGKFRTSWKTGDAVDEGTVLCEVL